MVTETRIQMIFQNIKTVVILEIVVAVVAWLFCQLIGWHTIQLFGGMMAFIGIGVGMIFYFIYDEPRTGQTQRIHGFLSPSMRDRLRNTENHKYISADNERTLQIAAVVVVSLLIGWLLQVL
jgi:hypothetical protein